MMSGIFFFSYRLFISVIIVNIIVQLIDNNILVPIFINTKVQINAFVSIVGIIIGNVLGGITGMFLAIPTIAIIKVIFDRIDTLEAWGYLLGDDLPKTFEWRKIKLPHYNYHNTTTAVDFNTDITQNNPVQNNQENQENIHDDTINQ